MKKSIFIFFLCTLFWNAAQAQPIMSYEFESKVGIYEDISGGTIVGKGLSGGNLRTVAFTGEGAPAKELTTSAGFPIGFDFSYNNTYMNKFAIGSDGYIILGEDQVTVDPKNPFTILGAMATGRQNAIGMTTNKGVAGLESTEISYKTVGTAPNRVLVVQFKDLGMVYGTWFEGTTELASVCLQFRLYETSNKIEIIYKNWINNSSKTVSTRVGIKGSLENDRLLRESKNSSWEETQYTTKDYAMMNWSKKSYPADGLTYVFTPPANCETPDILLSNLQLSTSSNSIKGSFDAASTADYYLVVMTETENLATNPVDKTYYKANDKLGNGTVILFDTLTTFTTPETLSGNKPYYFHIFAVNTFCVFGPRYNVDTALKGQGFTKPDKPDLLVTESGYDKMTLSVTKNEIGNNVLIAMTETPSKTSKGTILIDGQFGQPEGTLNIGDKIEGGGIVIHKGNLTQLIEVTGLSEYTLYHFKAWSFDEQGVCSTIGATANEVTWGKVPFNPDFSQMPNFSVPPHGWDSENFRLIHDSKNNLYQLMCDIKSVDPINGVQNSLTTPWILLKNGNNKIIFDCNLTSDNMPYNKWNEQDCLEIQISENGAEFTTIHTIDKNNAPQFPTVSDFITCTSIIENYNGKKVKIRFNWKCHAIVKLFIQEFKIEEQSACDYPINISVDGASVIGNRALIKWESTGEENVWDTRYRKVGNENWEAPIEVRTNPYMHTGLPINSSIELQVRAKCSLTNYSVWSKPVTFATGYAIPFTEEFNMTVLPATWNFESGILSDSTEFCTGTASACPKNWKLYRNALRIVYYAKPKDWVITPKIDLGDGSYHGKVEFDLKFTKPSNSSIPDDIYFAVVLSKDGGKSFREENILKELRKADFESMSDSTRYSIDLSRYSGIIKLGFYAYTQTEKASEELQLDNLMLLETCPAATGAKAVDVTTESAVITWDGNADEWLTFARKAGETKKDYIKQTQNKLILNNLESKTNYEIGVTKTCAENDTARVALVLFTTQSLVPCSVPSNISATPSQMFVTVSWEGEAMSYNVRFRQSGAEEWITKTTQTTSIKIDGLEVNTEYEYSLQSVCSSAEGDISPWTEIAKVKTLLVTCFVPTDVTIIPTHKSATINWRGEADNFQILCREDGKEWSQQDVRNAKTFTLRNLNASTKYSIRLRSICAVGDTSVWSVVSEFRTLEIPACVVPDNLRASGISDTSATLDWDANESNLSWDLRYREGTDTNWNTVTQLTQKHYVLDNLKNNIAYLWSVKATCDEGRTSAWAAQGKFTTQPSAIAGIHHSDLKAFVSNSVINVANPSGIHIEKIRLFSVDGKILKEYTVNSDENVLIPAHLDAQFIILKVYCETGVCTYSLIKK